ncbi:hypothetical protein A4H97_21090 [Niastella yeongjuensis]|uniref:HTH luxR-type domain-containing protein n=1 Tax=Niastella yeongjuensis TaxID=354355 RepID=A0A1V9FD11_9BACT|nr:sigma-70 family RNA polymerase sigma factor [Niastella yeongjuensis]OQP56076.1 hypothetical protein A4H97_21090 [Niastella yeongjuensis]SEP23874.1 RNA polymerase sigma-70 factor, ECF subfamily [Niastella yeongjuensis]
MKQQHGYNLVALFNEGSERAYYRLYEELYPSIFTFAHRLLPNIQEAEDVCSESFTKLFQTGERFKDAQSLKAFLFRITRNACLNVLRDNERHTSKHKELGYIIANEQEISDQELQAELVAWVYASIEKLPKKCRKVFKLTLIGFSYEEIAAQLNISESTVRNQKARGLKLLRIALFKEGQFSKTAVVISVLISLMLKENQL